MSSPPHDFTIVLARLLSQRKLRTRFHDDSKAFLSQFNLPPKDKAALLSLDAEALEQQANSLIRKRFYEVSQLIPRTMIGQRDTLRKMFFQFAENYWPKGTQRHFNDAARFCVFLSARNPIRVNSFEATWLNFIVSESRFKLGFCQDYHNGNYDHFGVYVMIRYRMGECYYRVFHWYRKKVDIKNYPPFGEEKNPLQGK